ncbi:MAG TPA: lytic transglycosylase domain-containing protein [Polyangiaceae bacterium]|nr:lytic transglycosylase domain-containing protein [Polyangiaceae bacterium]
MERTTALKKSGRSWALAGGLAVLGGVAYSCASCASTVPAARVPDRQPAKVAALPSSGGPASVAPVEPLSLEGFRPLLADPRYDAARPKQEAGDYAAAAELVRAAQLKNPPEAGESDRHRFLLARLLERAGKVAEARDAFVGVSEASLLAPYAQLGAGRMELLLGSAERALVHVGKAGEALPAAAGRRRLLADAALKSGAREIALREYRALLAGAQGERERAGYALLLLNALDGPPSMPHSTAELGEALRLTRLLLQAGEDDPGLLKQAQAHEKHWLSLTPEGERQALSLPSTNERLERLRSLVETRRFEPAQALLATLPAFDPAASEPEACEIEVLRGKVAASSKRSSDAEKAYLQVAHAHCAEEQRARALYAAGKAAASGGRHAVAVKLFAELERTFPTQSVADDARLYGALSSLELGDEAHFTDALASMPDDYPEGDMLAEGCFRLALRRMEKRDFQSAERPLARAVERLPAVESGRGGDFAGRERYFLARVQVETGELERGLAGYEKLIAELPLGYYVRAAYTALYKADAERARRALEQTTEAAAAAPPSIRRPPAQPELGFRRALELASVGELDWVRAELSALSAESAAPELLFNAATLYARAGAFKLSSDAARSVLGKMPPRFPAGAWLDAWKLAYPRPYAELVSEQAKKNALAPSLIYAVMREESAFDPDAESPADAYGLMQLILPTARMAGKALGLPHDRISLKRPSVNIPLGARVLGKYTGQFPQDPLLGVAAYNAGPGAAQRWRKDRPGVSFDLWVELIPYVETRRYIKRVLGSAAVYAIVYEEGEQGAALALPQAVSG